MDYENTVSIQTDSVSHTDATSTIRVEINPNATVGQELFYYAFCVAYNTTTAFDLVACASNEGEPLEIEHRWEKNGLAYMRVGIFDQSSHRSLIGCNMSETRVAGMDCEEYYCIILCTLHEVCTAIRVYMYIQCICA